MKPTVLLFFLTCFLSVLHAQEFQWASGYGSWSEDNAAAITSDDAGNSYICGHVRTGTQMGDYSFESTGVYVAKFDSEGEFLWARESGDNAGAQATAVATDADNNVIICGYYKTGISFEDIELPGSVQERGFLVKYDEGGNLLWATGYGTLEDTRKTQTNALEVDNEGKIYVAGSFEGTLLIGTDTLVTETYSGYQYFDLFLARFDQNGEPIWARKAGGLYDDYAYDVCCDALNNPYVAGRMRPFYAVFDSISINYENFSDIAYAAKYTKDGNVCWVHAGRPGEESTSKATSIVADHKDDIYYSGNLLGTLIFENDTLNETGKFLAKLDMDGNMVFSKTMEMLPIQINYINQTWAGKKEGLAIDESNNLFFTSLFMDTLVFAHDTLTSHMDAYGYPSIDLFVAKYNDIGYPQWANGVGNQGKDHINDCEHNGQDLFLCGSYESDELSFGEFTLVNNSGNDAADIFIAGLRDTTANLCPPINASLISAQDYFCENDSIRIYCEAENAYTYQLIWNNGSGPVQYSNAFWIDEPGNYRVIANPTTSCPDTSNAVQLIQRPRPVVNVQAMGSTSLCPGDTLLLQAEINGNYQLQWYKDDTVIEGATQQHVNVYEEGIYKAVAFGEYCEGSDSVDISQSEAPVAEIEAIPHAVLCPSSTISLSTVYHPDYEYRWYHDQEPVESDTNFIEVSIEGNYLLEVEDVNCVSTDNQQVVSKPVPQLFLPDTLNVDELPYTYNAGYAEALYQWYYEEPFQNLISTDSIAVLEEEGDYYVILANECGYAVDSMYVQEILTRVPGAIVKDDQLFYPNPAADRIFFTGNQKAISFIELYNCFGQRIIKMKPEGNFLSLAGLPPGSYVIRMGVNNRIVRKKLLINH